MSECGDRFVLMVCLSLGTGNNAGSESGGRYIMKQCLYVEPDVYLSLVWLWIQICSDAESEYGDRYVLIQCLSQETDMY